MRIGTTPTHTFTIPFSSDMIRECQIIYQQNEKEVLTKYKKDCTMQDESILVTLTQEETFLFKKGHVSIQVRVVTHNGEALASDIILVSCKRCLSDEVLE